MEMGSVSKRQQHDHRTDKFKLFSSEITVLDLGNTSPGHYWI